MRQHPFPEHAPNEAAPPPLPMTVLLADGRFAVRVGLRFGNGEAAEHATWTLYEWGVPAPEGGRPVEGWTQVGMASDREITELGGRDLMPLVEGRRIATDLDDAGQFAAARILGQYLDDARIRAGMVGR